jgi:hypothetical protein
MEQLTPQGVFCYPLFTFPHIFMTDETGGETPEAEEPLTGTVEATPEAPVEDAEEPADDAEGSGE